MTAIQLLSTLEGQAQIASRLTKCTDLEKALAFGRRIHHNIRKLKIDLIEAIRDAKKPKHGTRKRKR